MRIGLSFDLKEAQPSGPGAPEDAMEEYDSEETVGGIAVAIEAAGHSTVRLGGGRQFLERVLAERVDLVFNIAEGRGTYRSREAQVPGVLEMLGIPYTGSDPECLAICLDKPLAKQLVRDAGVATPVWRVVRDSSELETTDWTAFPLPAFIKPAFEGSSKGVRFSSLAHTKKEIVTAVSRVLELYHQPAMVEEFIAGDELTVGIIGNEAARVIGVMRVMPRQKNEEFVYSLEVKRQWRELVDYECPPNLPAPTLRRIEADALKIFATLGCRDVSRVDFRLRDGVPYFLEINPLPGLNPVSGDLPIMAGRMGISHHCLVRAILDMACQRIGR